MRDRESSVALNLAGELRRRKVLYTAVVYGISAFAITEIAAFLFDGFGALAAHATGRSPPGRFGD